MSYIKYIKTPYSYSAAVLAGEHVFLGLHRGFGEDFNTQLVNTMENIRSTLKELCLSIEDLVKVQVWLKDVKNLPDMEQAFCDYFPEGKYPARMTATTEFIDDDCLLMIEGTAYAIR